MKRIFLVLALVSATAAQTALPQLMVEAERNNPRIAAAEQAWRAAEQRVAPAGALPDPQATVQQMSVGSPLPFAGYTTNNFAYIGVGVSQDIPYPGKLKLRAQIAHSDAQALRAAVAAARRQVAEQVGAAYVQLAYLQQTRGLLQQQRTLLAAAEQLAEVRYRAGPGSQADVLAAQLAQTELLRDLATQQQQQAATQAELRALLNRTPGAPPVIPTALAPTRLAASDDQLLAMLPAADPALGGEQARIAGADHAVKLAHLNFRPDFNAQYMFQRTGPNFPAYYQWTVGMTL
ncbi:MAG TPA: TolC family protein, partial [Terriglobales bacterium]|nr:TolC family protein [Terriglobales bacterium]